MQVASANTPEPASGGQLVNLSDDAAAAAKAIAVANAFTVEDAESSVMAQETRAKLNTRIKDLGDRRMSITRKMDAAKKDIMDLFAGPINVLTQALGIFDAKVLAYDTEQENLRKEAQKKAEESAQRERDRLAAEATERQRVADAEAQRLRDEAAAKEAAGDTEGAAKLVNKAERTEEKAAQRVEVLQVRAAQVVAPIIQSHSAKASGSSFRDNWKWRLKDKAKINAPFLITVTNDAAIDAIVKSQKGNAESIAAIVGDGIEIFNDRGIASRRA
jgi:hypothetical protein